MDSENPLLAQSELPYELPPFDRINTDQFAEAFTDALTDHQTEVTILAANDEPPTFDNTVEALERSGQQLQRVARVFFNLTSADAGEQIQQLQADLAPKLTAHTDAIYLNAELFARIDQVFSQRDQLDLTTEQVWVLERTHLDFVRAGAGLPQQDRDRLRDFNTELSTLETEFQQRMLAGKNAATVITDDAGDLTGLSDDEVNAAAQTAKEAGHDGGYAISLDLPTDQPMLASLENRGLRERLLKASLSRGTAGTDHATTDLVPQIARLRAQRARLLGFSTHAAYEIADQTAKTPQAARELLESLARPAAENVRRDAEKLQKLAADDGIDQLQAWDWQFYAERLRNQAYDFSSAELRPYFELEQVLSEGVFYAAEQVYGITLQRRDDLPSYHPDVRVYEVFNAGGDGIGLFLADFYSRPSKRGGAWMNSLVTQAHLLSTKPVVVNNYNFTRPAEGKPSLLTYEEVSTLFHEFGHALHGLFSDVAYPSVAGVEVPRDFVEFPSQVNEMWALWPDVIQRYARHYQTGEPIPADLLEKVHATEQFNQAYDLVSYLAAALLDLAWHELGPDQVPDDVEAFEADALAAVGLDLPLVPPRYRSTYFAHTFFGGYSAGYYSYMWSEVLDADTVAWFRENNGMTRANGDHFRRELLAKGGSGDVMAFFRAFRGADPDRAHLLERKGLTAAG